MEIFGWGLTCFPSYSVSHSFSSLSRVSWRDFGRGFRGGSGSVSRFWGVSAAWGDLLVLFWPIVGEEWMEEKMSITMRRLGGSNECERKKARYPACD